MENNYRSLIENLDKNGLLPTLQDSSSTPESPFLQSTPNENINNSTNIFSTKPFGLSVAPRENTSDAAPKKLSPEVEELINDSTIIDGFDTDILCNSKFRKIDDKALRLKLKIARLRAELEEQKKVTEAAFLKSDKNHYQKLVGIQEKMEDEIKKLVAEYQNQQLKSIVVSPFAKVFSYIKNYVALR